MAPQDWKEVEAVLGYPYGRVRLRADDHVITLVIERGKGLRYVVAVYIDGVIEWGKTMRPEVDAVERKFWRCRRVFLFGQKERANMAAMAKKRGLPAEIKASYARQAEAGFEMLDPTFTSGKAACRHLRKTCAQVERLPDYEEAPAVEPAQ
ncbi:hypothetical protein [Thauera aromatica]|uniref:hypothetical protein n=1 Tax=Thauera aromatica TaxID=59405 RepID=UPI001FFC4067|nr:hypothetical protein [Thauera aromatica]MCK2095657.1 hypothetical protein [Thauera aromatica]